MYSEIKYFVDCKNLTSLKKKYFELMKKYHPDLAVDKNEIDERNRICAEINAEYDMLVKAMPKLEAIMEFFNIFSQEEKDKTNIFDQIVNGSIAAKKACEDVAINIQKPNIEYKYYDSCEGINWWEEKKLKEIDATIKLFWRTCYDKQIVGDEFAKLYELCQGNAEKIKRTIMFLSTGAIPERDIHFNLKSDNSIPFFNDNIIVDNLPDYNSFLLLSRESTKKETYAAWIEFCQKQSDDFLNRYYEFVVPKITNERHL